MGQAALPRPPSTRCASPRGYVEVECEAGGLWWVPRRCRHCTGCLLHRKRRTVAEIAGGARRGSWVCFVTLTSPAGTKWPVLMRRFQSLVKAIRKRFGRIEYAAVKEEGAKTGMLHLHIVMTGVVWIPWQWLSVEWEKRIGAWSVDIQRMATGRNKVAAYVAKYVTKAFDDGDARKLVTYSKGYREPFGVDGPHSTAVRPFWATRVFPPDGALEGPQGQRVLRWCVVCLGAEPVPKWGWMGDSFARVGESA